AAVPLTAAELAPRQTQLVAEDREQTVRRLPLYLMRGAVDAKGESRHRGILLPSLGSRVSGLGCRLGSWVLGWVLGRLGGSMSERAEDDIDADGVAIGRDLVEKARIGGRH